jgi:MYND finger
LNNGKILLWYPPTRTPWLLITYFQCGNYWSSACLSKISHSYYRWGPTHTPIFNCLLCATLIWPDRREKLLDVVRWLISIGVPVDGKDLSGTTALSHSLSTRPAFDPEFAQMLIDAGGDINARNRYGVTCAHEFCMVWSPDPTAIASASQALQFFLSHGGDPNIAENDGITALAAMRVPWLSGLKEMALKEEERRRKEGCAFCGSMVNDRNALQLLRCGRCKKVWYCSPPKGCQRAHWSTHKRGTTYSALKAPFSNMVGIECKA